MKKKEIELYFEFATATSHMSTAKRLKVGAVAVKDNRVISYGYNGTPAGASNCCEYLVNAKSPNEVGLDIDNKTPGEIQELIEHGWELVTKPEVCHAEENLVGKLAQAGESSRGCTVFITHAPCFQCAKMLMLAGVKEVFYDASYANTKGIDLLISNNIFCCKRDDLRTSNP